MIEEIKRYREDMNEMLVDLQDKQEKVINQQYRHCFHHYYHDFYHHRHYSPVLYNHHHTNTITIASNHCKYDDHYFKVHVLSEEKMKLPKNINRAMYTHSIMDITSSLGRS